jgi:hypothetical protein
MKLRADGITIISSKTIHAKPKDFAMKRLSDFGVLKFFVE